MTKKTTVVSCSEIPNGQPKFGQLVKGDYFAHGGKVYIKTNVSEIIRDEVKPSRNPRDLFRSIETLLEKKPSELFLKFNAVRVVDERNPHKVGSRGCFQDETGIVPLAAVKFCIEKDEF